MDDEGENEFVSEQVNEIVKVAFWLHFHASWSSVLQSQREEPMKISPELGPSYDQSDQGKPIDLMQMKLDIREQGQDDLTEAPMQMM